MNKSLIYIISLPYVNGKELRRQRQDAGKRQKSKKKNYITPQTRIKFVSYLHFLKL